ncbi:hypothetical protein F0562_005631 [Nyssa sinensis]|uniref:Uncharacterized protein n=1 Tax=Nyssa sinensis TaxID=561372 RepID=A0A5J5AJT4_9ASTE|nr:hypothetical protein F0562_005631 [Nyssa sinensis]
MAGPSARRRLLTTPGSDPSSPVSMKGTGLSLSGSAAPTLAPTPVPTDTDAIATEYFFELCMLTSVVCPFMLDQFYWAGRMFWLGVTPEPLKRNHLLPDEDDDAGIREAANMLARAINYAFSSKVKSRASEIARRISLKLMLVLETVGEFVIGWSNGSSEVSQEGGELF